MPRRICEACEKLPWSSTAIRRCLCHGCNLDLGSSDHKQKGFLGVDRRDIPNVDLIWDLESVGTPDFWAQQMFGAKPIPWPFPSACADKVLMSHVLEHITPKHTIAVMDELWRILKFDGQALIVVPHGNSFGYIQDLTHCTPLNDASFAYLDPAHESHLYMVYQPKPWKIARLHSHPQHNVEVVLEPRKKADGSPIDITIEKPKTRTRARRRK